MPHAVHIFLLLLAAGVCIALASSTPYPCSYNDYDLSPMYLQSSDYGFMDALQQSYALNVCGEINTPCVDMIDVVGSCMYSPIDQAYHDLGHVNVAVFADYPDNDVEGVQLMYTNGEQRNGVATVSTINIACDHDAGRGLISGVVVLAGTRYEFSMSSQYACLDSKETSDVKPRPVDWIILGALAGLALYGLVLAFHSMQHFKFIMVPFGAVTGLSAGYVLYLVVIDVILFNTGWDGHLPVFTWIGIGCAGCAMIGFAFLTAKYSWIQMVYIGGMAWGLGSLCIYYAVVYYIGGSAVDAYLGLIVVVLAIIGAASALWLRGRVALFYVCLVGSTFVALFVGYAIYFFVAFFTNEREDEWVQTSLWSLVGVMIILSVVSYLYQLRAMRSNSGMSAPLIIQVSSSRGPSLRDRLRATGRSCVYYLSCRPCVSGGVPPGVRVVDINQRVILWHGTSTSNLMKMFGINSTVLNQDSIKAMKKAAKGVNLLPSRAGLLGQGFYLGLLDKAKNFAMAAQSRGLGGGKPVILIIYAKLGRVAFLHGDDRSGSWHEYADTAFVTHTSMSTKPEWCVKDPSQLSVVFPPLGFVTAVDAQMVPDLCRATTHHMSESRFKRSNWGGDVLANHQRFHELFQLCGLNVGTGLT